MKKIYSAQTEDNNTTTSTRHCKLSEAICMAATLDYRASLAMTNLKLGFLVIILFLIIFPTISFSAEIFSYDEALQIKKSGNYSEAEKAFSSLIKKDPNNSELWFELGLVQRFQQKNEEALISQKKAAKISPQNYDAKLEIARLYLANKNYDQAEILLNEILAKQPKYSDASELLASIKKAKTAEKKSQKYPWQIDVGHQYSSFSRLEYDSWTVDSLQLAHWIKPSTMLHLRNENVQRFKQHDQYYEAGAVHNFNDRFNSRFSFGLAPNADFYPRSRINTGLDAKLIHKHKFLGDMWVTGDAQYNHYRDFNITVLKPGIRYAILNGVTIHLQHIDIINESKKHLKGWVGRTDWQTPLPQLRIFAGLANAPETQNAVTIDTKSRFIGTAYQITPRLTAYLSYNRDDRENSFIRKTVDGTLSLKF
jgi:YaiO family outer membrane protein